MGLDEIYARMKKRQTEQNERAEQNKKEKQKASGGLEAVYDRMRAAAQSENYNNTVKSQRATAERAAKTGNPVAISDTEAIRRQRAAAQYYRTGAAAGAAYENKPIMQADRTVKTPATDYVAKTLQKKYEQSVRQYARDAMSFGKQVTEAQQTNPSLAVALTKDTEKITKDRDVSADRMTAWGDLINSYDERLEKLNLNTPDELKRVQELRAKAVEEYHKAEQINAAASKALEYQSAWKKENDYRALLDAANKDPNLKTLMRYGKSRFDADQENAVLEPNNPRKHIGPEYYDIPDSEYLTDADKGLFYYLYARNPVEAKQWAEYAKKQNRAQYFQKQAEIAGQTPGNRINAMVAGTFANIAAGPLWIATLGEENVMDAARYGKAWVGGAAEGLNERGLLNTGFGAGTLPEDIPVIGGKGLGAIYELGSSMLQSASVAPLGAWGGAIVLGSSAAASDYTEMIDNGFDKGTAMLHATCAGIAESLFEYVSLDKLINQDVTRGLLRNIMTQAGVEASEEINTTLANTITDEAILGSQSQRNRRAQELMALGMSYQDAKKQADREWLSDLLYDGLAGAASGGLMTAGNLVNTMVYDAIRNQTAQRYQNTETGAQLAQNEILRAGVDELAKGYGIKGLEQERVNAAQEIQTKYEQKAKEEESGRQSEAQAQKNGERIATTDASAGLAMTETEEAQKTKTELRQERKEARQERREAKRDLAAYEKNAQKLGKTGEAVVSRIVEDIKDAKTLAEIEAKKTAMVESAENKTGVGELADIAAERVIADEYGKAKTLAELEQLHKAYAANVKDEGLRRAAGRVYATQSFILQENAAEGRLSRQRSRYAYAGENLDMTASYERDGQTVVTKIQKISEDGKSVVLENGETMAVKDLQLDADTKDVLQKLTSYGIDGQSANYLLQQIQTAQATNRTSMYEVMSQYLLAFAQGQNGAITMEEAIRRSTLDAKTAEIAYKQGQKYAEEQAQKHKAEREENRKGRSERTLKEGQTRANRKGINGRRSIIDKSAIRGMILNSQQSEQVRLATAVAEALGVDIRFWASTANEKGEFRGKQGEYHDGVIEIDVNAGRYTTADLKSGILRTMAHELTHFIQDYSENMYEDLKRTAFEVLAKQGGYDSFEALVDSKIDRASYDMTRMEAEDEVLADACELMLRDSTILQQAYARNETLGKKLLQWVARVIAKIKAYVGEAEHLEAKWIDQMDAELRKAFQDKWDAALRNASVEFGESFAGNEALVKYGVQIDSESGAAVQESIRTAPVTEKEIEDAVRRLVESDMGFDAKEARKWLKSLSTVSSVILTNMMVLDYENDSRYSWLKKKSDYTQGSVDFNNNCPKRVQFTAIFDRLQKEMPNRVFTASDYEAIRQTLIKHGVTVTCGPCFVEDRRQHTGEIAQKFIDQLKYGTLAQKFQTKVGNDTYIPTQYDLVTYDGLKQLYETHRGLHDAFVAFNNARGMAAARLLEGMAEYNNQIKKWSKRTIQSKNSKGGLRIFSLSDADPRTMIDTIQIVIDAAEKGLMIQGYTKKPWFARMVKDTGIRLLRSNIPKGVGFRETANGRVLVYDLEEGINRYDRYYKDQNGVDIGYSSKNIGDNIIGINDDMIRVAMATEEIDQIIPFHSSLANYIRNQKKIGDWKNYKDEQTDKDAKTGKVADKQINIYKDVLNAYKAKGNPIQNRQQFVEAFLEVCKDRGLTPRFERFLDKKNGEYVYTPGYEKFLVDYKLFDRKTGDIITQEAVKPIFDDEFNQQILTEYVSGAEDVKVADEDTYQAVKGLFAQETDGAKASDRDVASDEDYNADGARYSLRDVTPVEPSSDSWVRSATFDEVKRKHPTLFALDAEESDTRNPTQVKVTVSTYRKIYNMLKAEGFDGTILDASSGLGLGTEAGRKEYGFDVDDIEPFPDKSYKPRYTDYSTLDKKYDVIISNAVLNVIPQDIRDAMVVKIGEMLNPGGRAFINVRGDDVKNASSKVAIDEDNMEYFISSTGSYQKGFTKNELKAYLEDALGDGFTVSIRSDFGKVSAVVTKDANQISKLSERDVASDEDYLAAVERGDMETAQRMVDEVAKRAMPNSVLIQDGEFKKMWHHTTKEFTTFLPGSSASSGGLKGIYFTPQESSSMARLGDIHKAYYLNVENMKFAFGVAEDRKYVTQLKEAQKGVTDREEIAKINRDFRKETGIDAFFDWQNGWYNVLAPEIIKSADPVTYDDNGEVIPLSKRFDPKKEDIRWSERDPDRVSDAESALLQQRESLNNIIRSNRKILADLDEEYDNRLDAYIADPTDDNLNDMNRWLDESGYNNASKAIDKAVDDLQLLQKHIDKAISDRLMSEEETAIAKSGKSKAEYFRSAAVKHYGYTNNFSEAGYILSNGKLLNFSGEKGKSFFGERGIDHRNIAIIFAKEKGWDAVSRFMNMGNIRLMASTAYPGINISQSVEPTVEQYRTIRRFIREYKDSHFFNVDYDAEDGSSIGSLSYEGTIREDKIINDIKHFYATGEVRQPSSLSAFYSERDSDRVSDADVIEALDEAAAPNKEAAALIREAKQAQTEISDLAKWRDKARHNADLLRQALASKNRDISDLEKTLDAVRKDLKEQTGEKRDWRDRARRNAELLRMAMNSKNKDIADITAQLTSLQQTLERGAAALDERIARGQRILEAKQRNPVVREMIEKTRKAVEERKNAQIGRIRETRKASELRGRIRNLRDDIQKRMTNPSERTYIPPEFAASLVKVLDALDAVTAPTEGTKAAEKYAAQREAVRQLAEKYGDLESFDDPTFREEFDKETAKKIKEIAEALNKENVTSEDLQEVYEIVKSIRDRLRDATKLLNKAINDSIYGAARDIWEQQGQLKSLEDVRGITRAYRARQLEGLSTMRAVEMMASYDRGSTLYRMVQALEQGDVEAARWVMEYGKRMEALKTGKNEKTFRDALTKQLDYKVRDDRGRSVTMTKLQAIQILMTAEREAANPKLAHLQTGGATIRNAQDLMSGKSLIRQQTIAVTPELLADIQNSLTAWDKEYIKAQRDYFQTEQKAVGDVYYALKKRPMLGEPLYIPQITDKGYLDSKVDESNFTGLYVNDPGATKELKTGSKIPLVIDGMEMLMSKHVQQMANYIGLALPVRDFAKVYNARMMTDSAVGYDTAHNALKDVWGDRADKLLKSAIVDVQNAGRSTSMDTYIARYLSSLQSAFVRSALLINPSVTIKQAASYLAAGSVLSRRALEKGNRTMFTGADSGHSLNLIAHIFMAPGSKTAQRIFAEIDEHTPMHYQRRSGMSMEELAWDANRKNKLQRGMQNVGARMEQSKVGHIVRKTGRALSPIQWIQRMDVATTAALWTASKVQAKMDGYAVGSDEFWAHTTELYEQALRETQPMYDTLHRNAIQKGDKGFNAAVKYLFPFKTVPIQNHGQIANTFQAMVAARSKSQTEKRAAYKRFGKTLVAQTESAIMFAALGFAASLLKHNTKKYRDDDEELTAESAGLALLKDFGSVWASNIMPMIGGDLYEWAFKLRNGWNGNKVGSYDSFTVGIAEMINELDQSVTKLVQTGGKAFRGEDIKPEEFRSALWGVVKNVGKMFGIPAQTVQTYGKGLIANIDDFANGRIPALNDESVDRTPTVNAHRYFEAWLDGDENKRDRVYEEMISNYKDAGKSGEDAEKNARTAFTAAAKTAWENTEITDEQAEEFLAEIGVDDPHRKVALWKYKEHDDDYSSGAKAEAWYDRAEPAGISQKVYDEFTDKMSSIKGTDADGDGKIDSGSEKDAKTAYIFGLNLTDAQKATLYLIENTEAYKTYRQKIEPLGVDESTFVQYVEYKNHVAGEDKNKDGKADAGTKQKQVVAYIKRLALDSEQKTALFLLYSPNASKKTLDGLPW